MFKPYYKTLLILIAIALVARIGFSLGGVYALGTTYPYADSDGIGYHRIATNLLAGRGFSLSALAPFEPTQWRQPLYPLFLAGLYALGINPVGVSLAQAGVGALGTALIFLAGVKLFGFSRRVSMAPALMFAGEPYFSYLHTRFTAETLLAPILIGAVWLTIMVARHAGGARRVAAIALAAGALWGFAALTRANYLYFPPIFAVIIFAVPRRVPMRHRVGTGTCMLLAWLIIISPWIMRNHARFNTWTFSDTGPSIIYHNLYPFVIADETGESADVVRIRLAAEEEQALKNAPPSARIHFWNQAIQTSFASHPIRYVKAVAIHTVPFFIADGLNNIFAIAGFNTSAPTSNYRALAQGRLPEFPPGALPLHGLRVLFIGMWITVLCLGIRGGIRLFRDGKVVEATMLGCLIGGAAVFSAVGLGVPRYRMSIAPFLFLLAAVPGEGVKWMLRARIKKMIASIQARTGLDAHYYTAGGFYTVLTYVVQVGAGILTSVLMARYLPRETYGGFRYVLSLAGTLGILALPGMSTAMMQSLSRGHGGAYWTGIKTIMKWSILVSGGLIVAALFTPIAKTTAVAHALMALAVIFPLYAGSGLYGVLLLAKRDLHRNFSYGAAYRIMLTIGTIAALYLTHSLAAFVVAVFLVDTVTRGIMTIRARRFLPNKTQDPPMIAYGKKLSLLTALPMVSEQIDRLVVPAALGLQGLAVWGVATMIPDTAKEFGSSVLNLALPKLARWGATQSEQGFILRKFFELLLLSLIAVGIYYAIAPAIVRFLFPAYADAVAVSRWYALTMVSFPGLLFLNWFQAQKKMRELTIFNMTSAIAQIVATLLLVPAYGLLGAVAARAVGRAVSLGVIFVLFRRAMLMAPTPVVAP